MDLLWMLYVCERACKLQTYPRHLCLYIGIILETLDVYILKVMYFVCITYRHNIYFFMYSRDWFYLFKIFIIRILDKINSNIHKISHNYIRHQVHQTSDIRFVSWYSQCPISFFVFNPWHVFQKVFRSSDQLKAAKWCYISKAWAITRSVIQEIQKNYSANENS